MVRTVEPNVKKLKKNFLHADHRLDNIRVLLYSFLCRTSERKFTEAPSLSLSLSAVGLLSIKALSPNFKGPVTKYEIFFPLSLLFSCEI